MNNIEEKLIDIIAPVYNKIDYIDDFIKGFTNLNSDYFNLIIVDDGSTDGTTELARKCVNDLHAENIKIISQVNSGVSAARNKGITESLSKYIWFCDPDDLIIADSNNVVKIILGHPLIDVFVFSYVLNNVTSTLNSKVLRNDIVYFGYRDFILNSSKIINNYNHPATDGTVWDKIYKKECIAHHCFNEELSCSEDFIFNRDVITEYVSVKFSNEVIYQYNVFGSGTLSSNFNAKQVKDRISVEKILVTDLLSIDLSRLDNLVEYYLIKYCSLQGRLNLNCREIYDFIIDEISYFSTNYSYSPSLKIKFMLLTLRLKYYYFLKNLRNFFRNLKFRG